MQTGFIATARAAAALSIGTAAVVAIATVFANTEAVVARGFSVALEASGPAGKPPAPLVAGSEDYWLTRAPGTPVDGRIEPVGWAKPREALGLAVGDRLTITSGGRSRALEVVAVAPAPDERTRIDIGQVETDPRILVTCREVGVEGGDLIRFTIGDDAASPGGRGGALRTL